MPSREIIRREVVGQWLAKADEDVRSAEVLLVPEFSMPGPACFHAQQAVEKFLKALLSEQQVEFPKTHSITRLLELVQGFSPRLAESIDEVSSLDPYGVDIRYPGDAPEPSRDDALRALELARLVQRTILACLKRT